MISLLPNPRLVDSIDDGTDGTYAYAYLADETRGDTPANRVVMAWNVAGPKTLQIRDLPEKVAVTDMLGTTQTRTTENGTLTLDIGPFPVYIHPVP